MSGSTVAGRELPELPELRELIVWSRSHGSRLGFFAALYTHVAAALEQALQRGDFEHPQTMSRLNDVFFERYLVAFRAFRDGEPTSSAWAVAFRATQSGRLCVVQHLLLGMNAHINFDLGVAVAEAVAADVLSDFRADFDRMNALLSSLVATVSRDLAIAWPLLTWFNRLFRSEDDVIIDFSMRLAREEAWEGALRLSPLVDAERERAIAELDAKATSLAAIVAQPVWPANLIALVIRLGERGTVPQIIDDLLRL